MCINHSHTHTHIYPIYVSIYIEVVPCCTVLRHVCCKSVALCEVNWLPCAAAECNPSAANSRAAGQRSTAAHYNTKPHKTADGPTECHDPVRRQRAAARRPTVPCTRQSRPAPPMCTARCRRRGPQLPKCLQLPVRLRLRLGRFRCRYRARTWHAHAIEGGAGGSQRRQRSPSRPQPEHPSHSSHLTPRGSQRCCRTVSRS